MCGQVADECPRPERLARIAHAVGRSADPFDVETPEGGALTGEGDTVRGLLSREGNFDSGLRLSFQCARPERQVCEEITELKLAVRISVREVKIGVRWDKSTLMEHVSEMRVPRKLVMSYEAHALRLRPPPRIAQAATHYGGAIRVRAGIPYPARERNRIGDLNPSGGRCPRIALGSSISPEFCAGRRRVRPACSEKVGPCGLECPLAGLVFWVNDRPCLLDLRD